MANYIHWYYKALYSVKDANVMQNLFNSEDVDANSFCCGKPFCDAKPLIEIEKDMMLLQADGWCKCESMLERGYPEISRLRSLGPAIYFGDDFIFPKGDGIIVWQTEGYEDKTFAAFVSSFNMPSGDFDFAKDEKGNVFNSSMNCVYINGTPINELAAKEQEFVSEDNGSIIFNIVGKTISEKKLCAEEIIYASNSIGLFTCYSNHPLNRLDGKTGTFYFGLNGLNYRIFAGMNSKTLLNLLETSNYESIADFLSFLMAPGEDSHSIILGVRSEQGDACTVEVGEETFEIPINTFANNENTDIPAMIFSKNHDVVLNMICGGSTVENSSFYGSEVNSVLELELPEGETFDSNKFKWKTVSILNYDGSILARMVLGASYNGNNIHVMRTDVYTGADENATTCEIYVPEDMELPKDCKIFSNVKRYNPMDKKESKKTFSRDFYNLQEEEYIVD